MSIFTRLRPPLAHFSHDNEPLRKISLSLSRKRFISHFSAFFFLVETGNNKRHFHYFRQRKVIHSAKTTWLTWSKPWPIICFLNGPFTAYFSLFSSFLQTVNNEYVQKSCRWLDSNPGPLVSEATALSTLPQPLSHAYYVYILGLFNDNLQTDLFIL